MFLPHKDRATVLSQNNNKKKNLKSTEFSTCVGERQPCADNTPPPWNEQFDKAQWKNNIMLLLSSAVSALFVRW